VTSLKLHARTSFARTVRNHLRCFTTSISFSLVFNRKNPIYMLYQCNKNQFTVGNNSLPNTNKYVHLIIKNCQIILSISYKCYVRNKLAIDIVINIIYNPRMQLKVLHKTFMKKMQIFIRGRGREIIKLFIYFYPQNVI
jgi:hypothetical protein